ncbi:hypothetical protein LMH87_011003 [Akanthomyces muscarius]|uniref:Uncharacterized protein n=1 Tax=Akanthomyces muscarius TaxID=2231603 RepID=A0A9W8UKP0_AKAMU|nr:hypothetical protein LMH87_011003 [Akanthomyces muscarius]KAJ4150245.1 hypothetical protein LMH87_011003 [Akanthomyces muscarius]
MKTSELLASRPETEVTPTLYVLAKLRLLDVGAKVSDVATDPQPHSYSDILKLDKEIEEAQTTLPPILKWDGLALNVSSQIMVQRIWLEVICQQLRIVLHRKFLGAIPRDGSEESADFDNIKVRLRQAQNFWIRAELELQRAYDTQNIVAESCASATAISHFPEFNFSEARIGSVEGFNWEGLPADLLQSN